MTSVSGNLDFELPNIQNCDKIHFCQSSNPNYAFFFFTVTARPKMAICWFGTHGALTSEKGEQELDKRIG